MDCETLLAVRHLGISIRRHIDRLPVQEELIRRIPEAPMTDGARIIAAGFDILTEELPEYMAEDLLQEQE